MAAPSLRDLLEPAIVALSNLAAETAFVKDDMRESGAIDTCVQLLTAQVIVQRHVSDNSGGHYIEPPRTDSKESLPCVILHRLLASSGKGR